MGKGALWCGKLLIVLCASLRGGALGGALSSDRSDQDEPTTCAGVRSIFEVNNVSVEVPDAPISGRELTVCVSEASCCTLEMESALQRLVRRDFQALLHHNSRSLEGLLVSAANTIREHVVWQLRQSEGRTRDLLAPLLGRLVATSRGDDPLVALYGRLLARLEAPLLQLQQAAPLDAALEELLARLFPLAYERALGGGGGAHRLAAEYRGCLRRAARELRPVGDAPRRLAAPLQRALRAAGVLRQALLLGSRVLSRADSLLTGQGGPTGGAAAEAQCHAALVRMSHCWRCRGLQMRVRPCAGLCLNVLRGCLTQRAAELDLPWNGYVEAAERLLAAVQGRGAVDDALRSLDARIAGAVAAAVERSATLQQQVKRVCGPHMWDYGVTDENTAHDGVRSNGSAFQQSLAAPDSDELSSKLEPFMASLRKSRGFYANLAESLCSDESFAETRDTADCWNGERVGEYTKTVVASSLIAQKYNPELEWVPVTPDSRIAELSDQLRHLKQVVVSQLTEAPTALSLVRYVEGSGGDRDPRGSWDSEPEDGWRGEGSGSGEKPVVVGGETMSTDNTVYPSSDEGSDKQGTSTSSNRLPVNTVQAVCCVLLTSHILYVTSMW
ncbi:glypican-5-like [Schistocerca americana]|uniref:glypican-5-like n=1 Tax=Schistocerca americana TaxID=7009 RepID=UPI001F4F5AF4|nr:glypican-5-like [Schistocerca americana]